MCGLALSSCSTKAFPIARKGSRAAFKMSSLKMISPNENMPTVAFKAKPRLIHKKKNSPLLSHPVDMLMCPLQTFLTYGGTLAGRKWRVTLHKDYIREAFD
ncbi:hypothetical protein TNCV_4842711 [Trichonephila clavipes]|uniref:Uncharacterized protein n=1 Tax=Trichonephila clavipes TaxID=2585209 RepID=A0A8X7BMS5_TRICX|nr:hypothetical protein TNCV_4842711 [Trichonephila clavipes]